MKILIVLGGGFNEQYQLNSFSKLRYDKALEIESNYDFILLSSDKTYRSFAQGLKKSEARIARDYLISLGMPKNKILMESVSRDTFSNAFFCRKDFIDKFNINTFDVLTSQFHLAKSEYVFDLVFNRDYYDINYISCSNGDLDKDVLKSRIISEECVIDFYREHLFEIYGVKIGDMPSIENFMLNHNPAMIGSFDKYHLELTRKINSKLLVKNPLY